MVHWKAHRDSEIPGQEKWVNLIHTSQFKTLHLVSLLLRFMQ